MGHFQIGMRLAKVYNMKTHETGNEKQLILLEWPYQFNSLLLTLYRPYAPYDVFLQFLQTTVCAIWRILHTA